MEMENDKRQENEHGPDTQLAESHVPDSPSELEFPEHEEAAEEHAEEEHVDYSGYSKQQLVNVIKDLTRETNFKRIDFVLKDIKPLYDDFKDKERALALNRFLESGGTADDFDFKGDDADIVFDATFKLLRDRRAQYFREQEERKVDNLKRKEELLEKLRLLSDAIDNNNQFD